jgi:hypothetical protein
MCFLFLLLQLQAIRSARKKNFSFKTYAICDEKLLWKAFKTFIFQISFRNGKSFIMLQCIVRGKREDEGEKGELSGDKNEITWELRRVKKLQ